MTKRSVVHTTFVIERNFPIPRERVFAAWSDPSVKRRWFTGLDEWQQGKQELDFRVGGREHASGGPPGGSVHRYEAIYWDIVPNERIVYTYDMHADKGRTSVSLATVEFKAAGAGTKLIYTEQGAFLDGHDDAAERERGTNWLFDALERELKE
jgi:uncharacterized protein YndB with AHSA1/START domain